jgi:hypothetical protein
MVLFNIGTGAWDATCTAFGLPHMIVGSLPASSERIFSSGNERTTVFMNPPVRLRYCGFRFAEKVLTMPLPVGQNNEFGISRLPRGSIRTYHRLDEYERGC